MYKRMLRSVLATAFAAGLALGAATTMDLAWDSKPAGGAVVGTQSDTPPDLGWDSAPAKTDA
ncbi:hypothetical protein GCM10009730_07710 [Streptomyces albidochromogenes]|uniref:hypothetical protein n=1 Tax=Streptomyces albidochromogenes TaxID=329524 RepID=UPI00142F2634|nr:hypothetical protein [Streptomyces albidochromogenes]